MKPIVNEPQIEYKVSNWNTRGTFIKIDHHILKMEIDNIYVSGESLLPTLPIKEKKKGRISGLRGKIKKISDQDIDNELLEIRSEWERDF